MALIQTKCKCQERPLNKEYEALQEVAKGAPKSAVARKYDALNNTTWIKNKDKIMQSYRECGNIKRRRIRFRQRKAWIKLFTNGYLRREVRMQLSILLS